MWLSPIPVMWRGSRRLYIRVHVQSTSGFSRSMNRTVRWCLHHGLMTALSSIWHLWIKREICPITSPAGKAILATASRSLVWIIYMSFLGWSSFSPTHWNIIIISCLCTKFWWFRVLFFQHCGKNYGSKYEMTSCNEIIVLELFPVKFWPVLFRLPGVRLSICQVLGLVLLRVQ